MKKEIERLEKKIAFLQECLRREKKMDREQEELDAIERPVAQAQVESDEVTLEHIRLGSQVQPRQQTSAMQCKHSKKGSRS